MDLQDKFKDKEPTLFDVLEAINGYSTGTDQRLDKIEAAMVTKDHLEKRLAPIEANMVTKDYLDEKLSDLKGDLIVSMRKEDAKLHAIVDVLRGKNILSQDEERRILSMEPFPKLYIPR